MQCVDESPHNLFAYLGLEENEYKSIIISLGLGSASKQSADGMQVKVDKWQDIMFEQMWY